MNNEVSKIKVYNKVSRIKVYLSIEKFFALMSKYTKQSVRDEIIDTIRKEGFVFDDKYYTVYDVKKHFENLESKLKLEQWKIIARG